MTEMNNNYNIYKVLLDILRHYIINLANKWNYSTKIRLKNKFTDDNKKVNFLNNYIDTIVG